MLAGSLRSTVDRSPPTSNWPVRPVRQCHRRVIRMPATLAQPEEERLAWYRTRRDTDPVSRDSRTGAWNVFRYEDVATILADHQTFSSSLSELMPEASNLIEGNVLRMDPP